MIDTSFLDQLNRFNLIIKKKVTSSFTGAQRSTMYGSGTVLKDLRKYVSGDDIRLIDWNIFARTDKLHVKRFEEEKNLSVHVVVDFSKSMNFGTQVSKFHYASMLGIGFAYLAMRNNERFVFSTFSDRLSYFKPKRGMGHLAAMIDYLNNLKTVGQSNFEEMMMKFRKTISSKSLIVIISDFLFDFEQIKHGLYRLANNDVKVIQVLDRTERELDIIGDVKLHDSESDVVLRTYVSSRLRKRYLDELNAHSAKIQKTCDEIGAKFYLATTDKAVFDVFYDLLARN